MAALPAGVQYGLSSESSYKENKELVFVKLTDSALKAIEDFLRNNRDRLAKPKIQFLPGNEGFKHGVILVGRRYSLTWILKMLSTYNEGAQHRQDLGLIVVRALTRLGRTS
ncbi:hypothetical protein B5X24_HaOG214615 [Helicoverpa armigera]|nr:hypothetical protein B5X24_HaOG214615 [Helicoverpa armigera]